MAKTCHFNLKNRKLDPALLLLIFKFRGRRVVLSTGISVPQKSWDIEKERVRSSFPHYAAINARLSDMEGRCMALWYEYVSRGETPTAADFKRELISRVFDVKQEPQGVVNFFDTYISELEGIRPVASLRLYRSVLRHVEGYEKARRRVLSFDALGEPFVADFTSYLFGHSFADGYVYKILSTLKAVARVAERRGICTACPMLNAALPVRKRPADSIYLSEAELDILFGLEGLSERLSNVRDMFLIGAYSGLRFSDFSAVTRENVVKVEFGGRMVDAIRVTMKKTKNVVTIPLSHPHLRAILERHGWKAPRAISNQKMNQFLKELGEIAGFTDTVEVNEFISGRHVRRTCKKYELIGTHTARRSFCTNALKAGLSVPDVMKFSGHTSVTSLLRYLRMSSEEAAATFSDHRFFTGEKS